MAAVSSKGKGIQWVAEAAYAIDPAAGYKSVRVEGEPTVVTPAETAVPVNTLTINPYDGEPPVTTSQYVDGALTLTTVLRKPTTPGADSFIVEAFKSGGYQVASSDDTTVDDEESAVDEFDMDGATAVLSGEGGHILLPTGRYFPFLSSSTTEGTVVPSMALPEIPADDAVILGADTVSPGAPGITTDWLSFRHWNQMKSGANWVYHLLTGCGMESCGDIVVERGTLPSVEMTFRAATVTRGTGAALPEDDFSEAVGIQVWEDVLFGYATASTDGGIAAAYLSAIKATLTPGVVTVPVPESGSDADHGGLAAHLSNPDDARPRLTVEIVATESFLDDWEVVTAGVRGVSRYISLVQPGTAGAPGTGIFCPSARLIEQPSPEPYGSDYEKMTLVFELYPAGYDSTDGGLPGVQANQPWYLVLPSDRA